MQYTTKKIALVLIAVCLHTSYVQGQTVIIRDGEPLANQTLYTNYGNIQTDKNGKLDFGFFVGYLANCEQEYPTKIGIAYAQEGSIGFYRSIATNKGEQTIEFRSPDLPSSRVQISVTVDRECLFFVDGQSKAKRLYPGKHLEVATIPKVSSITLVLCKEGYIPFVKTFGVNTKDNKVSQISLQGITLKRLPCEVVPVKVHSTQAISTNHESDKYYTVQNGKVWFVYYVFDRDNRASYVGKKCVSLDCFNQDAIILQEGSSTERVEPKTTYVRIEPVVDFEYIQAKPNIEETTETPKQTETQINPQEKSKTSGILTNVLLVIFALLIIGLLYRAIWKKNILKDFGILK